MDVYDDGQNQIAVSNFTKALTEHVENMERERKRIQEDLAVRRKIETLSTCETVDDILKIREAVLSINPNLRNQFAIIDAYLSMIGLAISENRRLDLVDNAIGAIFNDSEVVNNQTIMIEEEGHSKDLERKSAMAKAVIEHVDYDYDFLVKVLEELPLSEEEKIQVLMREAYESIALAKNMTAVEEVVMPVVTESKTEELELIDVDEPEPKVEKDERFDELVARYNELLNQYSQILGQYPYSQSLDEEKREKMANWGARFAQLTLDDMIRNGYTDADQFNEFLDIYRYPYEAFGAFLALGQERLGELTTIYNDEQRTDKDKCEIFEVGVPELEMITKITSKLMEKAKEEDHGKEDPPHYKTMFLLIDGRPLFDVSSFDADKRKGVLAAIEKLENGNHDIDMPKKASKSIFKNDDSLGYPIYLNRQSGCTCSYVKVDDVALVLDIGSEQDVISNTASIIKKYRGQIDETISAIKKNKEATLKSSEGFISEVKSISGGEMTI